MLKLEPYIFDELKKSNLLIDDLKKKVHDVTNVDISQIEFRVNKLIQQEKLSNDKGIVSIKKQSSNQDEDEELIKITKEFMKRKFKKFMKDNWTEKYNTKCFYPDKSKCTKK